MAQVSAFATKSSAKSPSTTGIMKPKVTAQLAAFTSETTFPSLPARATAKLKDLLIDHLGIGRAAAATSESTPTFFKAVSALQCGFTSSDQSPRGPCRAYGHGTVGFAPQYAALLNGVFAHSFDFDDTLAVGPTHPGASVVPAALAQAEAQGASGRDLLAALAVGYEVVGRVGRALNTGAYSRGFHNTATAGIFGAVCAIANLRKLPAATVQNALGLALSQASGSMQFLEDGSWNKRLHPGWAAHSAFAAVALAEAGVVGSEEAIEGKFGLLHAYTDRVGTDEVLEEVVRGLGSEWLFVQTALKPFPACRFTHTAIELTGRAREALGLVPKGGPRQTLDVLPAKIEVRIPPAPYTLVGTPNRNKIHPITIVDGQFSIYYQVAAAWVFGPGLSWGVYAPECMANPLVAALCDRVNVVVDPDIPDCGARLAVRLAETEAESASAERGKSENLGSGSGSDSDSDGVVRWDWNERLDFPLGEEENPWSSEGVREKFRGLVVPVCGVETAAHILSAVDSIEGHGVRELMALL